MDDLFEVAFIGLFVVMMAAIVVAAVVSFGWAVLGAPLVLLALYGVGRVTLWTVDRWPWP